MGGLCRKKCKWHRKMSTVINPKSTYVCTFYIISRNSCSGEIGTLKADYEKYNYFKSSVRSCNLT